MIDGYLKSGKIANHSVVRPKPTTAWHGSYLLSLDGSLDLLGHL